MTEPKKVTPLKWVSHHKGYIDALKYMRSRQEGKVSSFKTPWSKINDAAIGGIEFNSITIIGARPGGGKDQPLWSTVYTKKGPKQMGSLTLKDEIIGSDGKPYPIVGIFPQGLKPYVEITFSDGSTVECGEDHLWNVSCRKERKKLDYSYKTLKTRDLTEITLKDGRANYKIPLCKPVMFEKKKVDLDPYILGLLIGDGGFSSNEVAITTSYLFLFTKIKTYFETLGYVLTPKSDNITYGIVKKEKGNGSNEIKKILTDLGLMGKHSRDKFIPKSYLYNSLEKRTALLQGLMDTDGYVDEKGKASYTSASSKLVEDVRLLCQSMGFNASFTKKWNKKYKRFYYTTFFDYDPSVTICTLPDKVKRLKKKRRLDGKYITSIVKKGFTQTQCIAVSSPDRLYLTDSFVVTHNTLMQDQLIREGLEINKGMNVRVLQFSLEMVARNSKLREFSSVTKQTYKQLCSAEIEGIVVDDAIIDMCKQHAAKNSKNPIDIVDTPCEVKEFKATIIDYMKYHSTIVTEKDKNNEDIKVTLYPNVIVTLDHSVLLRKAKGQSTIDMLNELGEVCTELKKRYPIAFIILSQLNRDVQNPVRCENGKYGNYIIESDIFGADALLQHADLLICLDRPALRHITAYGPDRFIIEDDTVLIAHILKTRTGDTRMSFMRAEFYHMSISDAVTPPVEGIKTK
jgi:intein/homing endonuclease